MSGPYRLRRDSVSGYTGIYWDSRQEVWVVQFGTPRKKLGRFVHLKQAVRCLEKAKAASPIETRRDRLLRALGEMCRP